MKIFTAATLLLAASPVRATQELTAETFAQLTGSGRNGIVKFYQSWCGHCIRMKPDWDKLAEEAPSDVFVADVNCGDETELCTEHNIGGYPTLKYWINGDEHDYDGGRSFDDLSTFVSGELAPKCTFAKVENCSEKGKGYIAKWEKKTVDEKEKEIERLSSILAKGSMKADLKKWVHERKRILKSGIGSDEL